jgi:hypothetical protein
MYVGHKKTNLQNAPPTFCKFMSGHIFDIYFHLPPQRAVPCHGEEPHTAAARRRRTPPHAAAAAFVARCRSPPPPPCSPPPHATAACRTPPPPSRTPSPTTTVRPWFRCADVYLILHMRCVHKYFTVFSSSEDHAKRGKFFEGGA